MNDFNALSGSTGKNGLVILWATPRSVSTAFEKCFSQHRDVNIIHEPFTDCYYFGQDRKSQRYGDTDQINNICSVENINKTLLDQSQYRLIFVKELAFQGLPYVDDSVMECATHMFILREPVKIYSSLIKLKPDFTEDEFGFSSLMKIFKKVKRYQSHTIIFDGDMFCEDPASQLKYACNAINITFDPKMLNWESGKIRPWMPHERDSQEKWHKTLEMSKGVVARDSKNTELISVKKEHRTLILTANSIYSDILYEGKISKSLSENFVYT